MIKLINLTKKYKRVVALDSVDLEIEKGKIYGILGPNGAGKSTAIKSIVGGVIPTGGSVQVDGKSPIKNRDLVSKTIGYMPQSASLYTDLTALENVTFFANLQGVKNARTKATYWLKLLGLEEKLGGKVEGFSGGMKTRVSLACALVHEPEILILDEPTAGLDPSLKRTLWKLFQEIADSGKTVIISTHLMEEAVLCAELIIINQGKILLKDTPENLIKKGKTNIKLTKGDKSSISDQLSSNPIELANYLRSYGLSDQIEALAIKSEGLEDILISLTDNNS